MDGFKSIEIKNFRGIKELQIDDLARVNVLLGHNNSGKTTVLEALLLLVGMSNPNLPQQLNGLRSNTIFSFDNIKYLFNGVDITKKPEFIAKQYDNVERHLELNLTFTFDENSQQDIHDYKSASSETITFFNTLKMAFDIHTDAGKSNYESSLIVNSSGFVTVRNIAEGYLEKNNAYLISANLNGDNIALGLSELIMRKQKEDILEYLKLFDSRINAIEIVNKGVFIGFEGIEELLPVDVAGDGLRRYLCIVVNVANPMNNIILIDEIDNGLHYTAYKKLWRSIFKLAVSTNKQVFITTHSKETLLHLSDMLDENEEYQDLFRMYTIENTSLKGHKAYKYGYQGLNKACMNDVELRSIAL